LTAEGSPVIDAGADTAADAPADADPGADPLVGASPVADAADEAAADASDEVVPLELEPDEQAASARPAAANPAMSFRLRARRTCYLLLFTARPTGRGTKAAERRTVA
jgi:hypothetical protein